jgi:hypothetical protein
MARNEEAAGRASPDQCGRVSTGSKELLGKNTDLRALSVIADVENGLIAV